MRCDLNRQTSWFGRRGADFANLRLLTSVLGKASSSGSRTIGDTESRHGSAIHGKPGDPVIPSVTNDLCRFKLVAVVAKPRMRVSADAIAWSMSADSMVT